MDEVLTTLRELAPAIVAGEPVAFVYLFGSHASGRPSALSDVDIAVKLTSTAPDDLDTLALRLRLSGAFERAVGGTTVDVVVLDEAPLPLAGRVALQGAVIATCDEVALLRWTIQTRHAYLDFQPLEQRIARQKLARRATTDG